MNETTSKIEKVKTVQIVEHNDEAYRFSCCGMQVRKYMIPKMFDSFVYDYCPFCGEKLTTKELGKSN